MVNSKNITDMKKNSHISGILNADCFFSIVLSHVEKYSFPEINKLRSFLQHIFPHVVIDLSGSAVQDAVTYYSAYYSFSDGIVKRKESQSSFRISFLHFLWHGQKTHKLNRKNRQNQSEKIIEKANSSTPYFFFCAPAMLIVKLKLVRLPKFDAADNVRTAGTTFPAAKERLPRFHDNSNNDSAPLGLQLLAIMLKLNLLSPVFFT